MKALKIDEDGLGTPLKEYPEHFVKVFNLTSTQNLIVQIYYADVVAASLNLQLYFTPHFPSATEVVDFREWLSTIFIDKTGIVVKNDNDQFARNNSSIGIQKRRDRGSICANIIPAMLPPDSFFTCNTGSSKRPGRRSVMVANKDEVF